MPSREPFGEVRWVREGVWPDAKEGLEALALYSRGAANGEGEGPDVREAVAKQVRDRELPPPALPILTAGGRGEAALFVTRVLDVVAEAGELTRDRLEGLAASHGAGPRGSRRTSAARSASGSREAGAEEEGMGSGIVSRSASRSSARSSARSSITRSSRRSSSAIYRAPGRGHRVAQARVPLELLGGDALGELGKLHAVAAWRLEPLRYPRGLPRALGSAALGARGPSRSKSPAASSRLRRRAAWPSACALRSTSNVWESGPSCERATAVVSECRIGRLRAALHP